MKATKPRNLLKECISVPKCDAENSKPAIFKGAVTGNEIPLFPGQLRTELKNPYCSQRDRQLMENALAMMEGRPPVAQPKLIP